MEKFIKYLKENGFKSFRKRYVKKSKKFEYFKESQNDDFFSTMGDYMRIYYIKDDVVITFGLNEMGKPPTLINPRPYIRVTKENGMIGEDEDDAMNICLQKENPDDIFKAIFDKNICFRYII